METVWVDLKGEDISIKMGKLADLPNACIRNPSGQRMQNHQLATALSHTFAEAGESVALLIGSYRHCTTMPFVYFADVLQRHFYRYKS